MKVLQKILFTFAMVIGLSFAVSAQKNDDQKKPPPKQPPPVIKPSENKKPPKNDDKAKKSAVEIAVSFRKSSDIFS